jgi:hypothetical protein
MTTQAITYTAIVLSAIVWIAVALIAVILHCTHNYNRYSFNELRLMAKQRGISAKRTWKKADYINALQTVTI